MYIYLYVIICYVRNIGWMMVWY